MVIVLQIFMMLIILLLTLATIGEDEVEKKQVYGVLVTAVSTILALTYMLL